MESKNSFSSFSPITNNKSSAPCLDSAVFRAILKKIPAFYPQNFVYCFYPDLSGRLQYYLKEGSIMKISQAIKNFLAYQKLNSKKTPFKTTGTSWQYSKKSSASGMYRR